ncbi:MAG: hypothetical protein NTY42_15495 [Planctomycetota bacterium]|nr:hypothetical protein [Planctomycetota bacterium]
MNQSSEDKRLRVSRTQSELFNLAWTISSEGFIGLRSAPRGV